MSSITAEASLCIRLLAGYQLALPGSPGEAYLRGRGIPVELARRHGLGYAAAGTWAGRDAGARVVIPHTRPDGTVVNLYGRAIGADTPRHLAHDHLPGRRALFNALALAEPVGERTHTLALRPASSSRRQVGSHLVLR